MTFEEWWDNREYPYTDKDCAEAAWHEAFIQGYNEGYSDGESHDDL